MYRFAVPTIVVLLMIGMLLPTGGSTPLEPAPTSDLELQTTPQDQPHFSPIFERDPATPRSEPVTRSAPYSEWEHLSPPLARQESEMVYDPVGDDLYIFGGWSYGLSNDLWRYDLTSNTWTELFPDNPPVNRSRFGMAMDTYRQEIIIWGGVRISSVTMSDMWKYSIATNTWTQMSPVNNPSARSHMKMVYSADEDALFMYGGRGPYGSYDYHHMYKYFFSNNTWWDMGSFEGVGRYGYGMDISDMMNRVFIYGGTNRTMGLQGTLVEIATDGSSNTSYNPTTNPGYYAYPGLVCTEVTFSNVYIYLVGGFNGTFSSDVWRFDTNLNTWFKLDTSGGASIVPHDDMGICYKHSTDTFYIFGGIMDGGNPDLIYAFSHAAGTWTVLYAPPNAPLNREGAVMVYSTRKNRIYMFGGVASLMFGDTWYYDLDTESWHQVFSTLNPPHRSYPAMAYDPVGGGIYLFGGESWYHPDQYMADLWYFDEDSAQWAPKSILGLRPLNRSGAGAVVNPANGHFYVYGGFTFPTTHADLWEYNPTTQVFTDVADIASPEKRRAMGMALDPNGGGFYVFGGGYYNTGNGLNYITNQQYRYDFTSKVWTTITTAKPPEMSHGWMTSGNGNLYLFGGWNIGNWNLANDIYVYNISSNEWLKAPKAGEVPPGRLGCAMVLDPINSDLHMFGGYGCNGGHWKYGLPYSIELNLTIPDGPVCYAKHHAYTFRLNISHPMDTGLLETISMIVDYGGENITLTYDEAQDKFTKIGDTSLLIDTTGSSADVTTNAISLKFMLNFEWAYPTDDWLDVQVYVDDENGFSAQLDLEDVFRVETDLEYYGDLVVSTASKGQITEGTRLKGEETVHWGGIRVVYEGTSDMYPPSEEFDVVVFDDDDDYWLDTDSSGRDISINSTTDFDNDPSDIHYINITGDAGWYNDVSETFEFAVDTQSVVFSDMTPDDTDWLTRSNVKFSVSISDQGGGLVNASSVEYAVWETGGGSTEWTSAGLTVDATPVVASVSLELPEGDTSFMWRAKDDTGNKLRESDTLNLQVDTSGVEFANYLPLNDAVLDTTSVEVSVTLYDNTSGVDTTTVEYQYSTDGGTTFSNWTSVICYGTNTVIAKVALELSAYRSNQVRWRAGDVAGNYIEVSDTITLEVELPTAELKIPSTIPVIPINNTVVPTLKPTFQWNLDYDGTETVTYSVHVSKGADPLAIAPVVSLLSAKSYTMTTDLEDGATYQWCVIPSVGDIDGTSSTIFSFTTSVEVEVIREVTLTLETESIKIELGELLKVNLTVANTGDITETVALAVSTTDGPGALVDLPISQLIIPAGDSVTVTLWLHATDTMDTGTFNYVISGDYGSKQANAEMLVQVFPVGGSSSSDGGGIEGSTLAIAFVMIAFVLIVLVVLVLVLVMVTRRKAAKEEPAPAPAAKPAAEKKPAAAVSTGPAKQQPTFKPVKQAAPEEDIYNLPPSEVGASGDVIEAEMTGADIFREAAFHKGYDAAKGTDDVMDVGRPEVELPDGGPPEDLEGWGDEDLEKIEELERVSELPDQVNQDLLSLPPAVYLDVKGAPTRTYNIEEILIMSQYGILLTHFSKGSTLNVDEDVLAGMLTAVQTFVKDSFKMAGNGISDLTMGEFRIFISQGKYVSLAAVVSGTNSDGVRRQLDQARKYIEESFGDELESWNGEMAQFAGIEDIMREFLEGKYE